VTTTTEVGPRALYTRRLPPLLLACPPEEGQAWMGKMLRRISFGINKVLKKIKYWQNLAE